MDPIIEKMIARGSSGSGVGVDIPDPVSRSCSNRVRKLAPSNTANPAGTSHRLPFCPSRSGHGWAVERRSSSMVTTSGIPSMRNCSTSPIPSAAVSVSRDSHSCRSHALARMVSHSVSIPPPAAALPLRYRLSCGTGAAPFLACFPFHKNRRPPCHRGRAPALPQTLKRNSTTSPSCITYSLPSLRMSPFSLAACREPHAIRVS